MNTKLRELKRLVEIAIALEESARTVTGSDLEESRPGEHQKADLILGDFIIYFNRAPKLCAYCGDLGHSRATCPKRARLWLAPPL